MAHHKELRDEVADLASKAFARTHVRDNSKIYTGCTVRGGNEKIKGSPLKDKVEVKGDILVRDICMQGTDSIHNMGVVNTDATS